MKLKLSAPNGFTKVYLPFPFPAYDGTSGYCYLKVQVIDDSIVFVCAQLLNYSNTSITNAFEKVRECAALALLRDGIISIDRGNKFFNVFKSNDRIATEFNMELFSFLDNNSTWIEFYSSTAFEGSIDNRYLVVKFPEGNTDPTWIQTSKAALSHQFPEVDLDVPDAELESWVNARLSVEQIKMILKKKGWTIRELATRWNKSETWISKLFNDCNRDSHWDDSINGLPYKPKS